jgi:hypothetical protein
MGSLQEIPSQPVATLFGWSHLPSVPFKFLPDFLKIPGNASDCDFVSLLICREVFFQSGGGDGSAGHESL